mgnify:FL=1
MKAKKLLALLVAAGMLCTTALPAYAKDTLPSTAVEEQAQEQAAVAVQANDAEQQDETKFYDVGISGFGYGIPEGGYLHLLIKDGKVQHITSEDDYNIGVTVEDGCIHVTLDNVDLTDTGAQGFSAISTDEDLHVTLVGENKGEGTIISQKNLTIDGDGSLSIALKRDTGWYTGFGGKNSLTVKGNAKLQFDNQCSEASTSGLYSDGNVKIEDNANITLQGNLQNGIYISAPTDGEASGDADSGKVIMQGTSTLVCDGAQNNGVYAYSDIIVDGATLTLTNGRSGLASVQGNVEVKNSKVTIENASGNGIEGGAGYNGVGNVSIENGEVKIESSGSALAAVNGVVSISGTAKVEAASGASGIYSGNEIKITGDACDVTLKGEYAAVSRAVTFENAENLRKLGGADEASAQAVEPEGMPNCKYLHIFKDETPSPVEPAENGKIDVNGTWLEFAPEATKYYKVVDGTLAESAATDATITVEATENGYHVTLDSAEMTNPTAMQGYAALHTTRDLHLTLVGENVLPGPVVADGTLTVDGTGSAQVTVDNTSNLGCMLSGSAGAEIGGSVKITGQNTATFGVTGLYTRTGDAVIKNSADVSLNGNMENGVLNMHASLRIQGGRLYINGARVQDNEYHSGGNGVYAYGDVTVDGGTLEITNIDGNGISAGSGKTDITMSGIDGGMTVNSGTVKISDIRGLTVGNSVMGQGISAYKDVVVNGGRVEISNVGGNGMDIGCMDNNGNSIGDFILNGGMVYLSDIRRIDYGKYGYGGKGITTAVDIKINDGTVATLNVGVNDLFSNGNTIIKGGKVLLAKSGTALVSYKGITIDNGTVYISDSAYGSISAYQGDIAINGGSVTVDYSGQAINTVLGDVNIADGTVTVKRAQESGISSTQGDVNISGGTVTVEQAQKLGINVFTGSSDAYKGTIRVTGGKVTVDAVENALQAFSGGIVFGGNAVVESHSEKSVTAGSGDITVTENDCDVTLRTNAQSAIGGWIKLENADKIVALGGNSEKEAAEIKREEKDGKMQLHPTGCKYLHIAKGLIPAPTPTQTPVKTPTPTDTPAVTPAPTKMPVTPVETPNPTVEPTQTPTNTPAVTPAPTNTPAKTPKPTKTPAETPTPTKTPVTPAESPKPTAAPTAVPTTAPTAAPTSAPTAAPEPTAEPTTTPAPTASPAPTATPAPTQAPTSGGNSNSNKTNDSTNNTTTACPAPAQSTPAPAVQTAKVPQTSDVFPYTALVVLALASAAGLALLFLRKKKQ